MRNLANFISYLFHPLLTTTYVVALLVLFYPELAGQVSEGMQWPLIFVFFILTFVLPSVMLFTLKVTATITSFHLYDQKERTWPIAFSIVFYGITTYFILYKFMLPGVFIGIMVGITTTMIILLIVNFFWKISAHGMSSWGMIGIIFALHQLSPESGLLLPLLSSILIAGLVSSARLYLNAHNPAQIYMGGIVGFIICYLGIHLMY
ncbi:MAG: hypothetical protein OEY34_06445 [Cyclobacteriaceae bacterium]|nr:hypothetical protein [Cyclobacteriaceae bacterium]